MTVAKHKSWAGTKFLTTRKWCELSGDHFFRICHDAEKSDTFEQEISIADIKETRRYTLCRDALKICEQHNYHSFEVETTAGVVFVLTCETMAEKDRWLAALIISKEEFPLSTSSYRMQIHSLSPSDVLHFVAQFRRLGADYEGFVAEQRAFAAEYCGVDVSDAGEVFAFLQSELLASGLNTKLLMVLLQLMLIPSDNEMLWDAVLAGVQPLTLC